MQAWKAGDRALFQGERCQILKIGTGSYKNRAKVLLSDLESEPWVYLTQLTTNNQQPTTNQCSSLTNSSEVLADSAKQPNSPEASLPETTSISAKSNESVEEVPVLPINAPIAVVLFSGGGGVEAGLVQAGIRPVIAVEFDPDEQKISSAMADVHDQNFRRYGCSTLRSTVQEAAKQGFPGFPRKPNYLHASPVCSNFSVAKGCRAIESSSDIEAAHATVEAIKQLQPKHFTLENVKRYESSQSFRIIVNALQELGYVTNWSVVNLACYGLPQSRKRLILRASKEKPLSLPKPSYKDVGWHETIADLIPVMNASTLLPNQKLAVEKYLETNEATPLLISRTGRGVLRRTIPAHKPCYTLTRSSFTDSKGANRNKFADIWLPTGEVKSLSLAAAARLQGFPSWYVFPPSTAIAGSIIGYSVPPSFIFQLFSNNETKAIDQRESLLSGISGVYLITCTANQKVYVGSSIDMRSRWNVHIRELNASCHSNKFLQYAWNKYGESSFVFSVLERVSDKGKLIESEQKWIDTLQSTNPRVGLNLCAQAGNTLGFKFSEEQRNRISLRFKGKKHSADHVEKRITRIRGIKRSDESREKISDSNGKGWLITYPDGTQIEVRSLKKFCKENSLNDRAMAGIARGVRHHHHGFKCQYLNHSSSSTVEQSSPNKLRSALRSSASLSRSAESSISTHSFKPVNEPFLKWAGGKTWAVELVKAIYAIFKDYRLVSLTLGGGAIELGLQPERSLLCDINPYLINCWKWVKEDGEFTIPLESREEYFKEIRDCFNANPLDPLAPQWFYLLNHTCFNGLQRGSSIKHFNVGWGKYKKFHGQTDLTHYKTVMSNWEFKAQSWEQTLLEVREDDFLIFDPPYHGTGFKEYYGRFTDDDQLSAATNLAKLINPIVAFNAATPEMLELYQDLGFDVQVKDAPRSVACNGDRTPAKEMIATKNLRRRQEKNILSFLERSANNYPTKENLPTPKKRSKNKTPASGSLCKVGGKTLKNGSKTERWLYSYSEKVGDKFKCVKRHVPNSKVELVRDAIANKLGYEYICTQILAQPPAPGN